MRTRPSALASPIMAAPAMWPARKKVAVRPGARVSGWLNSTGRKAFQQARRRHLVVEGQLALLLQPHLHDRAGVGVQHARQLDGDRRGVDGHIGIAFEDQFQRAGVVGVRVGDQDGVQAAVLFDQAEVGQLVAGQPPARLGRGADAGVDQQPPAGDFDEDAGGADLVRAAEKGDLHDGVFPLKGKTSVWRRSLVQRQIS